MSLYSQFKKLHAMRSPLVIGNIWDGISAILAEKNGFPALGTSSHAIASSLGYQDGEQVPINHLYNMIEDICKATSIPISVDFESGYSQNPKTVTENVQRLADLGVAGINIEDSRYVQGKRILENPNLLAEKISSIKAKSKIFVNARTDCYTTNCTNKLFESITRGLLYKSAGADGLFVPLIETANDIKELIHDVNLPLNVVITSQLPRYDELKRLGVKRISHGPQVYEKVMQDLSQRFNQLYTLKDWNFLFD